MLLNPTLGRPVQRVRAVNPSSFSLSGLMRPSGAIGIRQGSGLRGPGRVAERRRGGLERPAARVLPSPGVLATRLRRRLLVASARSGRWGREEERAVFRWTPGVFRFMEERVT